MLLMAAANSRHALKAARPSRNGEDKQSEILAAAVRIFREKGYHAASMQDLADAVGLQKASLYYYVSSKEDLLTLIYERFIGAFTRQLTELLAEPLPATEKLRRAIATQVVALSEQIELFTVYLNEIKFLNPRLRSRIHAEAEHQAELLQAILQQGVAAGEFRELDVKMTVHAIIGMCNWTYRWYSPKGTLSANEIAGIFGDIVLHGIAAVPAAKGQKAKKRLKE
jgi:AcrR family transcriptional regulator